MINSTDNNLFHGLESFDLLISNKGFSQINLFNLWHYRELLGIICWRDVKTRYRQTMMGVGWAIAQPLISMVVFACFFGKMAKLDSDSIPYPLFSYLALLPWTYFANSVNRGSGSLLSNAHLVTKVYFPRNIIPMASALTGLIDFMAALVVSVPLLIYYHFVPSLLCVLHIPFIMLICFSLVLGLNLWLSAINVRFRDVGFLMPFLIQMGMFATPVVYSASLIPNQYRILAYFNPMFGIVEGFRSAVLGKPLPVLALCISMTIAIVLLITGLFFFRVTEKGLADVI